MAFEATLGKWVAAQFNIRNAKKIVPTPNVTLERAYDKSRKLKRETHVQLLKELGPDWSERKVERWFRHKRKDFTEQIVHHIATLLLLSLSYVCNFTRIGTLVMWAHDISDIFLESAKLCVYARKTTAADILFGLFACAFFLSRLVYYPLWILDTSWNRSMRSFSPYFGYYVFNS